MLYYMCILINIIAKISINQAIIILKFLRYWKKNRCKIKKFFFIISLHSTKISKRILLRSFKKKDKEKKRIYFAQLQQQNNNNKNYRP